MTAHPFIHISRYRTTRYWADDIVSAACKTGDVFREVRVYDEQMEGCVTLSEQGDLSIQGSLR